jgi:predicted alpha/beta superfamily hydrolase
MRRFRISWSIPVAMLTLAAGTLEAQTLSPRPVPTRGIVSFTFDSPSMGVRYGVNVGLPPGFDSTSTKRYPALVTTDGDRAFMRVYDNARTLMDQRAIEAMFVVSIGTAFAEGDSAWTRRRIYEFSPPGWDMKDPFGQEIARLCKVYGSAPDRCVGGAPRFLNAIVTELIPLVAAKYPIDREQLGLFGVSAGGFFVSWAIFQPNSPFRKYVISSPAMAYGRDEIFRQEERYAAEHKDLRVAIYMAAGEMEMQGKYYEAVGHIVSGMAHFAGMLRLRSYPGLELVTEIHPGMNHGDATSTAVVRGLRSLYKPANPEPY